MRIAAARSPLAKRIAIAPTALALTMVLSSHARAQAGNAVKCDGQIISDIQVQTRPPYYPRHGKWWESPIGIISSLHTNTKPGVVRRFLLVETGQPCDDRRRSESERLLRAQPFIASASVNAYDDGNGGVIIVAQTTDELTTILNGGTSPTSPYLASVTLGEGNFKGDAKYVSAHWAHGKYRDYWGASYTDYQFLGKPWHLDLQALRGDAGISNWLVGAEHRFLTDEQRFAWRGVILDHQDIYSFRRTNDTSAVIDFSRKFADIGGVVRLGQPGRLSLFGMSISSEDNTPALPPELTPGVPYDSLMQRLNRHKNARLNLLWGIRSIDFVRVERFDALTAAQDMSAGFQFGALLGRSLEALGSTDDDIFLSSNIYAGAGNKRTFAYLQATMEGRNSYTEDKWDGVIGSAHLSMYQRLMGSHTLVASIDWAGIWNQRVPVQLPLGELDGGVRGYHSSPDAGNIRFVSRLEDRWYLGRLRDQADIGMAVFADAGRVWKGDAPLGYGDTTPLKYGAGLGVLVAVPPGSKVTYRLDIARALSPDLRARWQFRVSFTNSNRFGYREPRDVRSGRELVTPNSVFNWP
ncbi:MAG: BamA/TamA family outer membrane protein [Gemmatimonadaceae bacterium]|nr:BamA/TamA family outer membrane protein [Gemmatimonadaceae bacterium]